MYDFLYLLMLLASRLARYIVSMSLSLVCVCDIDCTYMVIVDAYFVFVNLTVKVFLLMLNFPALTHKFVAILRIPVVESSFGGCDIWSSTYNLGTKRIVAISFNPERVDRGTHSNAFILHCIIGLMSNSVRSFENIYMHSVSL